MLVFAAFTPHSPLLLPSINKDRLAEVQRTREAMAQLAEELYAARPDTIIVISSHGTMHQEAFSIDLHDPYHLDLSEFGDLTAYRTFHPDLGLIDRLQRALRRDHPVTLNTNPHLHYGAAVPLLLLTEHLEHVAIIPFSFAGLSAKDHYNAGVSLQEVIHLSPRRIAVIGSGDQSHTLTTDSPGGFAKEGALYDAEVQEFLKQNNTSGLLQMKPKQVLQARECSYRSLLILLGALDHIHYWSIIHSYEAPFGVGYLVAHFELT